MEGKSLNRMAGKGQARPPDASVVVVALPFAYREGADEYNGVMRFLRGSGEKWDLRVVRHSFGAELFRASGDARNNG